MWSSMVAPGPLYFAGLVPWPPLPMDELPLTMRWIVMDVAEDIHHVLIIVLVAAIPLHVAAALKHHFWNRHDVLRGMLPEIPDEADPRGATQHKPRAPRLPEGSGVGRSEEHTSELQSLMRISSAVFCLKKTILTNSLPYYSDDQ